MQLNFETLFSELYQYHRFSVWWVGGVGGKPKAGYTIHNLQRQSHCALNEAQKKPQCTCQVKTVVGSSLIPRAALIMLPSGTVYPVVDRHEFTGSEKSCL